MRAVGVHQFLPTSDPQCFVDCKVDLPHIHPRDLLVKVKAISVNPVDTKIRASLAEPLTEPKILGWDAAGVVEQVGSEVSLFKPGDEVFYAGSVTRPGCNSEYQGIDERIVGRKPQSLSFEEAAALPLTTITAWESLFERLGLAPYPAGQENKSILIIGGAGGVGSIAIQLAKKLAGMKVIATASRADSSKWCLKMGADHVINHYEPLASELAKIDLKEVDYILCLNNTDFHWEGMAEVICPQGKICSIVGNKEPLDLNLLKSKSVTFSWEFMFTKSKYETEDMRSQHDLLNQVSQFVDQGVIQSTMMENFGQVSPENLSRAHAQLEAGRTIGKLVLSGL